MRDLVRWLWESTSTTERVLMLALGLCLSVMAVALLVGLISAVSSSPDGVSPKLVPHTRVEQVYDPSTAPPTTRSPLDEEHP